MKHLIIIITLLISTFSAEKIHICTNGLFKCVSTNSLRICLTGQLISSEVFCPNNTHCSEASPTVCTNRTLNIDNETYSSQCNCTESGIFPLESTNCQRYFQCIEMGNSFMVVRLKCYIGYFDPFIKACTTNYTCPETSPNAPKCTQEGTIPYPNTKCQNYVLCQKTPSGFESLVKYCISGYFNAESGECDQNYLCPEFNVPSSSTESTTNGKTTNNPTITNVISTEPPESTATSTIHGTTPSVQQCKQQGKFVVPNSGCTKYKWCILTTHGLEEYIQQCQNGSLFDPNLQQCSEGYICQNGTSTSEPETTTHIPLSPTSSTITTSEEPVVTTTIIATTQGSSSTTQPSTNNGSTIPECSKTEIRPVPRTSCTKYMVCQITSHGLSQQIKSCQNGTLFDPLNMVCTIDYICTETENSTESSVSKNPECILGETNSLENTNCTKYVRCSLTSNGMFQEVLSCPLNTVFDSYSKECSENYVCPDNDISIRGNTVSTIETTMGSTQNIEQECTKRGKFPILNTYCTKYMNCLVTTHGFSKIVLKCTPGKYFDPSVQGCTETYLCPETVTTINTISPSIVSTTPSITSASSIGTTSISDSTGCTQQGSFVISNTGCKNFRRCILTTNGFLLTFNECLPGSLFDPTLQQCSKLYVCTEITIPSTTEDSTTTKVETTSTIDNVSKLCTTSGKIPVSGTNCTKYILCAKISTGFVGKIYECPNNFFFDPIGKRCNTLYKCTENAQSTTQIDTTSTTEFSTTTKVETTIPTIDDISKLCTTSGKIPVSGTNCTKYILCAKISTGFVGKIYECPNNFFFDPIGKRCNTLYKCTENAQSTTQIDTTSTTEFSTTTKVETTIPTIDDISKLCTTSGKIPVSGTNCTKYILCAKISTGFVGKIYECPNNFFFDPIGKRCNSLYKCTENAQTTTQIIDTTSTTESSTTTKVETTTPIIDDISKLCTTLGKIPVLGTNCTKYILCAKTSTGLIGKVYECPNGFFFDPIRKRCNGLYQCTENAQTTTQIIDTTSTTESSTTTKVETTTPTMDDISKLCTTLGKIPVSGTNCAKYILCAETSTGLIGKVYECPNGFFFDPIRKRCNSLYQCTENGQTTTQIIDTTSTTEFSTTTKVESTTSTIDDISKLCTTLGKIPVSHTNCTKYILCAKISTGFVGKIYECPNDFFFDPIGERCNSLYQCTENAQTTTKIIDTANNTEFSTTTQVETTTLTIDDISKLCTTLGKIPVSGTNCTKYILCAKTSTGLIGKVYECPNGFFFDPIRKRCNSLYQCTENAQTTTQIIDSTSTTEFSTTTKVDTTIPTIDDISKLCTTLGKIPVSGTNCAKYILCAETSTGLIGKVYECPNGFFFDPIRKRCNSLYQCTENAQTTTQIIDSTSTTEFSTTTKVDTTIPTIDDISKLCTTLGKIPVSGTNCAKYILCAETSTGLIGKVYECPNGFFFDPIRKRCNGLYQCTENAQTTTQIIDTTTTTEFSTTTKAETTTPTIDDISKLCTTLGKIPVLGTNCTKYILCAKTSSGLIGKVYECPNGFFFDPIRKRCNGLYQCTENAQTTTQIIDTTTTTEFSTTIKVETTTPTIDDISKLCTTLGKIPVLGTNCTKYILCAKTSTGLIGKVYECPNGFFFNPITKRCNGLYQCTENAQTTTQITDTTSTTEFSTTTKVETTTSTIDDISKLCTTLGKIPVLGTNCTKYILCAKTSTGLIGKVYECPNGFFFDPITKRCNGLYQCTENAQTTTQIIDTTSTTEFSTTTKVETTTSTINDISKLCTALGKIPVSGTNCTKYILCAKISIGFVGKIYECPSDFFFDPIGKRCNSLYKCTENAQTTTEIIDTTSTTEFSTTKVETITPSIDDVSKLCTTLGKIPVLGANCTKYILCAKTSTGLIGKVYECPNGFFFDPIRKRCNSLYQCTENTQITTQIVDTGTTEFITTTEIMPIPELPKCITEGRFTVPGTKCKQYILCVDTKNGFVSAEYSCPENSLFNPVRMRCSINYTCEDDVIKCSTIGSFPDDNDSTCKNYYNCVIRGDYIQAIRKQCNQYQFFDPEIQRCTYTYFCNNKLSRNAVQNNVVSPRFLVNGQCTTVGRYVVQLSNCKNYVYCSVNTDGTLKGTNFTCPTTTVFNQAIQKCTSPSSYTCPDSFCANNPGLIWSANPNIKGCTSYIICQPISDTTTGLILGYTGIVNYCPNGQRFNPMLQICDPMYVCPSING